MNTTNRWILIGIATLLGTYYWFSLKTEVIIRNESKFPQPVTITLNDQVILDYIVPHNYIVPDTVVSVNTKIGKSELTVITDSSTNSYSLYPAFQNYFVLYLYDNGENGFATSEQFSISRPAFQ